MNEELKTKVGSTSELREILACSQPHAWRLWHGRTRLTKANEKLIRLTLKHKGE